MDRVAFTKKVWTVVRCFGTQSIVKTGLNRPLIWENLDKLEKCERRLIEILTDSATDEGETNSSIKMTHQESSD